MIYLPCDPFQKSLAEKAVASEKRRAKLRGEERPSSGITGWVPGSSAAWTSGLCRCMSQYKAFLSFFPLCASHIYIHIHIYTYIDLSLSACLSISHLYFCHSSFLCLFIYFSFIKPIWIGFCSIEKIWPCFFFVFFFPQRAPHETNIPQNNLGTVVLLILPNKLPRVLDTLRNFLFSVFTWKSELVTVFSTSDTAVRKAVQIQHFQNETRIFCWKYTTPMSPILINLYTNDVPDQGYDREEHTVLALIDLSF